MFRSSCIQKWPEMFESLASCFAFRCSASLNVTDQEGFNSSSVGRGA
jgi:hypothetical protein